jgi:hypothetical protein
VRVSEIDQIYSHEIVCGKLGLVTKNNLRVNLEAALPSLRVVRVDIE